MNSIGLEAYELLVEEKVEYASCFLLGAWRLVLVCTFLLRILHLKMRTTVHNAPAVN